MWVRWLAVGTALTTGLIIVFVYIASFSTITTVSPNITALRVPLPALPADAAIVPTSLLLMAALVGRLLL